MNPDSLSTLWSQRWAQIPPLAWSLRTRLPERWIRFHSLPDSKRYAENELEQLEVLARHHAILQSLGAALGTRVLTVTVQYQDGHHPPPHLPELAAVHLGAWHWRGLAAEDDDQEGCWHLFVNEGPVSELGGLLRMVANDEYRGVMILPLDLTWIFHPYDGGADVITATRAERDVLAGRFAPWRSARPDGL